MLRIHIQGYYIDALSAKQCVRAGTKNLAATDRTIGLIEESTTSEMERIVFLNQILGGATTSTAEASVGSRLLESELKLLQIWNQQRRDQLKGVTNGS